MLLLQWLPYGYICLLAVFWNLLTSDTRNNKPNFWSHMRVLLGMVQPKKDYFTHLHLNSAFLILILMMMYIRLFFWVYLDQSEEARGPAAAPTSGVSEAQGRGAQE